MNAFFTSKPKLQSGLLNRLSLILFSLFLFSSIAFAGSINLAWDPSPSTNVGGYKLYYGTSTQNYTSSVDVGNVTSYQITGLQDGASYFFSLKAYNVAKSIESSFSNEVSATVSSVSTVTADFSASVTSGNTGMVVAFTPITTGTIAQWSWDFGDGTTSAIQSPTHTYNVAGVYSVSLTVTGTAGGSAVKTGPNLITVTNPAPLPPVANFILDSVSGVAPKTVIFTDISTGDISSRLWDFGDGSTSTLQNPTHVYSVAGVYSVSLSVTGSGGSKSITKSNIISITAQSTSNGPVLAFNFEGSSTTTASDLSGNGNDGAISGPTVTTSGRYGNAIQYSGINDIITVKDSPSLDLSTGFTLEAWVKPTAIKRSSVIFKEQAGGDVYSLYVYEDGDIWSTFLNDGVDDYSVSGTSSLPINQWTHIVSTYDGIKLQLYKNGILESSSSQSGLVKVSDGALQIGGNLVRNEYFQGYLDEIKIYNRALSSAEVLADMQNSAQLIVGNKVLEPKVDSAAKGRAEAFKTTALKSGTVNAIQVYLEANTLTKMLVAGIYSDNSGHPGTLLAQGKLSTVKPGATNTVTLPAKALIANKPYWIAILGTSGQIKFRDRMGSGISPTETSKASGLTVLPNTWSTGAVYPKDGPMSVYGTGY